ncbi:hypothetical protein, partial [Curtanaerobium respiraculi]
MDDERTWRMIQEAIAADIQGRPPNPVVSRRTLFGIKSGVEEAVEKIARDDEVRRARERAGQRKARSTETRR